MFLFCVGLFPICSVKTPFTLKHRFFYETKLLFVGLFVLCSKGLILKNSLIQLNGFEKILVSFDLLLSPETWNLQWFCSESKTLQKHTVM